MRKLEAWYGAPPDRDRPVLQLFLSGCGPQWGEVRAVDHRLVLEVYPNSLGESWVLPLDELQEVFRIAEENLKEQLD